MVVLSNSTDQEKLVWSIWSVNLTRQVQDLWRRVELHCFNAKPELLHPRAFSSSYLQCMW